MKGSTNLEVITEASANLYSPFSNNVGEIYFACKNGKILKYKEGHRVASSEQTEFEVGKEPSAVVMDSLGKKCYIADMAEQRLSVREMEDKTNSVVPLAQDFEGQPFLGPYALALSDDGSSLRVSRQPLLHRQRPLGRDVY